MGYAEMGASGKDFETIFESSAFRVILFSIFY